jgi:hypothetical protein
MRLGGFGNVHRADFHHYTAGGVVVEAVCWRSAALQLRRPRRDVVPSAQVIVHEVHGMLRGLKKADVKHSGISLLWSHALVVHQSPVGLPALLVKQETEESAAMPGALHPSQ